MANKLSAVLGLCFLLAAGGLAVSAKSCAKTSADLALARQQAAKSEDTIKATMAAWQWESQILREWEQKRNDQQQSLDNTKKQVATLSLSQPDVAAWRNTAVPESLRGLLPKAAD